MNAQLPTDRPTELAAEAEAKSMFYDLTDLLAIWKLRNRRARELSSYRRMRAAMVKEGATRAELDTLQYEGMMDDDASRDELEDLVSRHLNRTAERLLLPGAPEDDITMYRRSDVTGRIMLSTKGMVIVRDQIRQERRHRREAWIVWIGALTGLIGVLVGLVSVLRPEVPTNY